MKINVINNQNFGFRLSSKINKKLDEQKESIINRYGRNSQVYRDFEIKRNIIKKVEPELYLDAEDDFLINKEALVITVYDKDKKSIFDNNNNYEKYGNKINIDCIFDFVLKYVKDKNKNSL